MVCDIGESQVVSEGLMVYIMYTEMSDQVESNGHYYDSHLP